MINDNIFNENERFLCLTKSFSFSFIHQAKKKTPKRTIDNFTINFLQYILFFKFPPSLQIKQNKKNHKPKQKTIISNKSESNVSNITKNQLLKAPFLKSYQFVKTAATIELEGSEVRIVLKSVNKKIFSFMQREDSFLCKSKIKPNWFVRIKITQQNQPQIKPIWMK